MWNTRDTRKTEHEENEENEEYEEYEEYQASSHWYSLLPRQGKPGGPYSIVLGVPSVPLVARVPRVSNPLIEWRYLSLLIRAFRSLDTGRYR